MRKQITHISVLQTAKVAAAMWFVMSVLMIVIVAFPTMMITGQMRMPGLMLVVGPLIYVFFGFVFTVIGAWVYNMLAGVIGGVEYTTTDVDKA